MLQCTAFATVPEMGALVVLTAMNTEPGPTPHVPGVPQVPELDDVLLCELGEHDDGTEHAAQLWAGEMDAARDLWMFWTDVTTDTGMRRKFRFAELPRAPPSCAPWPPGRGRCASSSTGTPPRTPGT